MVIAYAALCQLRDNEPAGEPEALSLSPASSASSALSPGGSKSFTGPAPPSARGLAAFARLIA
jgi:hypothetical protein